MDNINILDEEQIKLSQLNTSSVDSTNSSNGNDAGKHKYR